MIALVMTLSTVGITSRELASFKTMSGPVIISLLLNYVVMGGIIILLAGWLIDDSELWTGFIVVASVPPPVAVVPFSYLLSGNTVLSLLSMVAAYLAALVLTPAIMVSFLGVGFINPVQLVSILAQLIIVPLIASRILLFTGLTKRIEKWRGTVINWCFFVVVFTIIGLNRQVFFEQLDVVLRIAIISFSVTFILGHVIELFTRVLHVDQPTSISLIIIGTKKNFGLSGALALTLFGKRASIPGSVGIVFGVLHVVWLGFYQKLLAKSK